MIGGFGCGVGVSLLLFLEEWCEYCCARICAARLFMIMLGRLAGESVGWLVGGGEGYRYGVKDWIGVRGDILVGLEVQGGLFFFFSFLGGIKSYDNLNTEEQFRVQEGWGGRKKKKKKKEIPRR